MPGTVPRGVTGTSFQQVLLGQRSFNKRTPVCHRTEQFLSITSFRSRDGPGRGRIIHLLPRQMSTEWLQERPRSHGQRAAESGLEATTSDLRETSMSNIPMSLERLQKKTGSEDAGAVPLRCSATPQFTGRGARAPGGAAARPGRRPPRERRT